MHVQVYIVLVCAGIYTVQVYTVQVYSVQVYYSVCMCRYIVLVCACAGIYMQVYSVQVYSMWMCRYIVCRCILSVYSSYTCSEVESTVIYPQVGEQRKAVQSLCWYPGEKVIIEHQNLQLGVD